ncbi:hypothetical protein M899_3302 [Bacteriovorax sp. BSW11_IV]|uniref:hypothetical protein n=1 Tax=Bacteriovorax sp. BSW11_IV TaxID=1353529 RepID=UPI000389E266|nr:hypothetical protein [Bacteriovorax sp. BSW11_IV]EQC46296.1 hypothetical protein M899_3302 [Bacteriovorax sp. BSW11_IV]
MKKLLVSLLTLMSLATLASEYPVEPDAGLTPGELCKRPSAYRYPEKIAYCNRDVSKGTKDDIFRQYRKLGYRLKIKNRADYKIDHYIPLCAGGSNSRKNLWPQHKSIFKYTDAVESVGCQRLKEGRISQKALIELIKYAKSDYQRANQVVDKLARDY